MKKNKVRKPRALSIFATTYFLNDNDVLLYKRFGETRSLNWELPAIKRFHAWLGSIILYLESKATEGKK